MNENSAEKETPFAFRKWQPLLHEIYVFQGQHHNLEKLWSESKLSYNYQ